MTYAVIRFKVAYCLHDVILLGSSSPLSLASKITTVNFPAVGTYLNEKQISPNLSLSALSSGDTKSFHSSTICLQVCILCTQINVHSIEPKVRRKSHSRLH